MNETHCGSEENRVRFEVMTDPQRRHYAAQRGREEHPDDDRLAQLRANVIYANHVETQSGKLSSGYVSDPKAAASAKAALREYMAAKHGDKYDDQTGYRPWLSVIWPQATTDGSRPDLAGKSR